MIGLDLISQFRSVESDFKNAKDTAKDTRREALTEAEEQLGRASIEARKHLDEVRAAQTLISAGSNLLMSLLPTEAGDSAAAGGSDLMTGAISQFQMSLNRCINGLSIEPAELVRQSQELKKKASQLRRA
jgi:hypothetical protein